MPDSTLEAIARQLEASHDYRVLRRFKTREQYGNPTSSTLGTMCLLDFETTGLSEDDRAIEIGMVLVEYDRETGVFGNVVDRYVGQEDPGIPIPENIVALTGLTNDAVRGRSFDDDRVHDLLARSGIIVAHNAMFDRAVGERRFPAMAQRPWACSMSDVPWKSSGHGSLKLQLIAQKYGVFYDGHRADVDCEVVAFVLSQIVYDGHTALKHLLTRARADHFRVWATGAPFSAKPQLKANGYTWCDAPKYAYKAWRIETDDSQSEIDFLAAEVFGGRGEVIVESIGPKDRFTERSCSIEPVTLGQGSILRNRRP